MSDTDLALAREFVAAHPGEAARVLERHPAAATSALLEALDPLESAALLDQLAPTVAAECLLALEPRVAGERLASVPVDAAASLLRRLPEAAARRILDEAPEPVLAAALRMLIAYPEGTAGALLDPTVLAVPSDLDAKGALERVLRDARHTLYYVYVVDRARRLVGVCSLRELMQAAETTPLAEVAHAQVARLRSGADVSEILAHSGWQENHALPVVDDAGTFLGVIRYRTLRRLERSGADGERRNPAVDAALSLGELYWFGLSSILEGMASAAGRRMPAPRTGEVTARER